MEAMRTLSPSVERTIAETALLLRDEAEVLDRDVAEALEALGGGPAISLSDLRSRPPALARLVLRELAERAAGGPRSLSRAEADAILALGSGGGTRSIDLGDALRAVSEYGTLRFTRAGDAAPPEPVELPVPGRARFGDWELEARPGGAGDVEVSADALGPALQVRSWRDGDRMRPVGLGGSKTLQDLFTDRKVPRTERASWPVVEAGGKIACVPAVAVGEGFRPDGGQLVALSARRAS
jgi:tRNA(Ile)-lysidine synthase